MGSWLRFVIGRFYIQVLGPLGATAFPWGTLTVNVLGSLAMGVLIGWLARHGAGSGIASEGMRLFLTVGVLGGFTTFSAFSLEIVTIFERGQTALALTYGALSLIAGIAALAGALALTRAVA